MQNCSKLLCSKFSKPKMSKIPIALLFPLISVLKIAALTFWMYQFRKGRVSV